MKPVSEQLLEAAREMARRMPVVVPYSPIYHFLCDLSDDLRPDYPEDARYQAASDAAEQAAAERERAIAELLGVPLWPDGASRPEYDLEDAERFGQLLGWPSGDER